MSPVERTEVLVEKRLEEARVLAAGASQRGEWPEANGIIASSLHPFQESKRAEAVGTSLGSVTREASVRALRASVQACCLRAAGCFPPAAWCQAVQLAGQR